MPTSYSLPTFAVAFRQLLVTGIVLLALLLVVGIVYWKDRQREWRLREGQANHRLDLVYESITRDLNRVRSDVLYVSSQKGIRDFVANDFHTRQQVEVEFANFLQLKGTYQQIRLIDEWGCESVRVDINSSGILVVPVSQLQDKSDRYYFVESLKLKPGEIFISEFDLNQERGAIEKPLNPVIRFVTPVLTTGMKNGNGPKTPVVKSQPCQNKFLLVANYKGKPLLDDMSAVALPGATYLVRNDGQFLLGPEPDDAWGWLLNHDRSFDQKFPDAWRQRSEQNMCRLTPSGAFSFRTIDLTEIGMKNKSNRLHNQLIAVSHLPNDQVFATSRQLLYRLLLVVLATLLPVLLLTRFWAVASLRRKFQNELISASERKLRELSSRLVNIQEEERRAISREIHDQLGQQATAINLDLKLALREATDSNVRNQLKRTVTESEQLLSTLHDFATRVRPVELDDLGLYDAIESHIWEFKDRTGIQVEFDSNLQSYEVPTTIAENVYRMIQESLNNVSRHADAHSVEVAVKLQEVAGTATQNLLVIVKDDGVGTLESTQSTSNGRSTERTRLGILGMRERVDLLDGELKFESVADQGTLVEVKIPVTRSK